jgi:translation initiation factor 3 subunit I
VVFPDPCLPTRLPPGDTSRVLTGAADNTARLWDCESGKEVEQYETNSAVRTCGFSRCGKYLMYSTDATMKNMCEICLYDIRASDSYVRLV